MTPRQRELLLFVQRRTGETGVCPTVREIMAALAVRSTSCVVRMLVELEAQGCVRRRPGHARAIEVLQPVQDVLTPVEITWCHDHAHVVRRLIGGGAAA